MQDRKPLVVYDETAGLRQFFNILLIFIFIKKQAKHEIK